MLNKVFMKMGFAFIESGVYVNQFNASSLHDLKKFYDLELEIDQGNDFRKRAYLKLQWQRKTKQFYPTKNQNYFQTADSNTVDGGKIRQFKVMDKKILNLAIMQSLIHKNLAMINEYEPLLPYDTLTIGMHFIRYIVNQNNASFSSPDWLHKDDEPLVFIHLVELSRTALGGDNLIADDTKKIMHVIRLENDMDTLVLNKAVYHAVTPLGSRQGTAIRDVLLFTIEPHYTQIETTQDKAA